MILTEMFITTEATHECMTTTPTKILLGDLQGKSYSDN